MTYQVKSFKVLIGNPLNEGELIEVEVPIPNSTPTRRRLSPLIDSFYDDLPPLPEKEDYAFHNGFKTK